MIFCSLYSGSSGNSIFISSEHSNILIDAGLPGKRIEKALNDINKDASNIDGIFITHEHTDHIKGVGVLSRKYDIPIYANTETWNSMCNLIGKINEHNIKIIDSDTVDINDLHIMNFKIPHDAANPCGYSISQGDKRVSIATDLGYFSDEVKESIKDSDVILLESNHDTEMLKFGPYPYPLKRRILSDVGHLSNDACGKAISEIIKDSHKTIILGHLSKTNNYPDLAYATVANVLSDCGFKVNKDLNLCLAKRDMPSGYIEF
ncbi:MAG: Metallo-beta-lactamase superfamily hydrolase [Clostridiaceae bacterium]|nr:Metallo-beta-lactamase superfamily hydrolase [Clostridiaceae bacterium]